MKASARPIANCPQCGQPFETHQTGQWFDAECPKSFVEGVGWSGNPIYQGVCRNCKRVYRAYGRVGEPVTAITWEAAMPSQSEVGNRGDTRTPQSASALVEALRTNHVEAKCRVLAQLQQLGPALSEAVPSVLEALNDPAEAILWQSNGWDPPEEWFYYGAVKK
jgi:hypothetical protein